MRLVITGWNEIVISEQQFDGKKKNEKKKNKEEEERENIVLGSMTINSNGFHD